MTEQNSTYVRDSQGYHLGCSFVAPIALFGTAMIADYPGPPGRFGALAFPGWWSVCLAVSAVSAAGARASRRKGSRRLFGAMLMLGAPIAFGALALADVHPTTPVEVKLRVEHALQLLGLVSLASVAVLTVRRIAEG